MSEREQSELRAEVERLGGYIEDAEESRDRWIEYAHQQKRRAKDAEAKVARVETTLADLDERGRDAADDSPADRQSRLGIRQAVRAVRAAMEDPS